MIFTLQRYVFRELLKVFIPTAIALTMMLSLGSILSPVQEYGVGPEQVLHLMGYFLPITLTFVLPMAALFAAALVYGRFASDNELDACRASGLHLLTLVYPGLVLAILVAIANLMLSFHVMPAFVLRAEKSLKADAKQILFRNLKRKGYYRLPPTNEFLLYADAVSDEHNTLAGIVIQEFDRKELRVEKVIAADAATINFQPHKRFNEVQIVAYNTVQVGPEDEFGFSVRRLPLNLEFGSMFGDEIKFKKIDEMKRIRVDPIRFDPVARLAQQTYMQLMTELLAQDVAISINAGKPYRLHSGQKLIDITANDCLPEGSKMVELTGEVVIDEYEALTREHIETYKSAKALLHIEGDELWPTLTLDVYNARRGETGDLKMRHIVRGLILPRSIGEITDQFKSGGDIKPRALATGIERLDTEPSTILTRRNRELQATIDKMLLEIKSVINSRLVFGIGCVPMIIIGIGLGIIKRGGHLLSAFGISCVPAAVLIICIMSGRQMTENPSGQNDHGLILMWGGLAFLFLLAVIILRKLTRT